MKPCEVTLEYLKENYEKLTLDEKIAIAKESKNEVVVEYLFYDEDPQIKFQVVQNEYLALGKLKRLARDPNQEVREMAIVMYERRLIY